MAICTLKGHVSRAMDFYNKEGLFFAIAKPTQWSEDSVDTFDPSIDYEQNPPAPKNTDELIDIIGYKRVEFRALVVQDPEGSLEYRNTRWRIVPYDDAVKEGARWVFISSELVYNELPCTVPYRQVGLFSGVKLKDDVNPSLYAVLPDQVKDSGLLEVIDNRKPVYRDVDVKDKIKLVLEF